MSETPRRGPPGKTKITKVRCSNMTSAMSIVSHINFNTMRISLDTKDWNIHRFQIPPDMCSCAEETQVLLSRRAGISGCRVPGRAQGQVSAYLAGSPGEMAARSPWDPGCQEEGRGEGRCWAHRPEVITVRKRGPAWEKTVGGRPWQLRQCPGQAEAPRAQRVGTHGPANRSAQGGPPVSDQESWPAPNEPSAQERDFQRVLQGRWRMPSSLPPSHPRTFPALDHTARQRQL